MRKMAVTPFDLPYQKTPTIHAYLMALYFIEPELWSKFYIAERRVFDFLLL